MPFQSLNRDHLRFLFGDHLRLILGIICGLEIGLACGYHLQRCTDVSSASRDLQTTRENLKLICPGSVRQEHEIRDVMNSIRERISRFIILN